MRGVGAQLRAAQSNVEAAYRTALLARGQHRIPKSVIPLPAEHYRLRFVQTHGVRQLLVHARRDVRHEDLVRQLMRQLRLRGENCRDLCGEATIRIPRQQLVP